MRLTAGGGLRRLRRWLFPRSGGMRVGRVTARLIARGDAAMRARDWAQAVPAYRTAVARQPGLRHIWIQLGHALKEQGDRIEARAAYEAAYALDERDVEPLIRLAHMAKDAGERIAAARHFVAVLRTDPANADAGGELVRLLRDAKADPELWQEALACLGLEPPRDVPPPVLVHPEALFLDVGDLLGYLTRARLPTGIQRVQIEVALASADAAVLCAYSPAERAWLPLPTGFAALCRAGLVSDDAADPAWIMQVRTVHMKLALTAPIRFAAGCALVNLGMSWGDRDYLADVRRDRRAVGLRYAALVYDLIPVLHPEWFVPDLVRDYRRWFDALLGTADGYVAISEATRRDLIGVAATKGVPVEAGRTAVVRIDGDFHAGEDRAVPCRPAGHGLAPGGFVLLVSTIEPRKNHVGAFAAWRELAAALGEARVPMLVCVGGRGWLNDHVHATLAEEAVLRRKVLLLSGVPDEELAALYRDCLFTLYPSFYEGWGLPVSESLGYGKVPAISRTSSLPEAGGDHAVYFDPTDPRDIAAAITPLIVDAAARAAREAEIRRAYRARPWTAIAGEIADFARAIAAPGEEPRDGSF